ncbi:MAG: hypothetical protein E7639_01965 [Ruminococcaceae bacterium]|nr:hypothetical protein [Oscillospiraceae bacterium]
MQEDAFAGIVFARALLSQGHCFRKGIAFAGHLFSRGYYFHKKAEGVASAQADKQRVREVLRLFHVKHSDARCFLHKKSQFTQKLLQNPVFDDIMGFTTKFICFYDQRKGARRGQDHCICQSEGWRWENNKRR